MAFIKTDPFDSESAKSEGEKMLLKALGEGKDTAGVDRPAFARHPAQ